MSQLKSASSTTDPTATTSGTTTPAGTDPTSPFSHTNTSTAAPSVSPVQSPLSVHMSSPPHKPRFTRSPTPYTLQDMDKDMDDSGDSHQLRSSLQRSSSTATESNINLIPNSSSSTTSQDSSNISNSDSGMKNYTYLNIDNKNNNSNRMNTTSSSSDDNNSDYKKPTAGWTLFAQLAKMTPEEVELIRLTKANTAANKQIHAVPVTLVPTVVVESNSSSSSSSSSNVGSSETLSSVMSSSSSSSAMDATLPNFSPKRSRQRRKELSLSPPPPHSLSVVSETSTHDRQQSLMASSSSSSSSEGGKSPDLRSSPSTNERGSLSPPSKSSSPSSPLSSQSSQESSPRQSKKTKLDHPSSSIPPSVLWSSYRRKSSLSSPKSVLIDESKNIVFSYRSSSSIEKDYIPIMDEETYSRLSSRDIVDWNVGYADYKNRILSQKNLSNTTASSSPSSSTSSPWHQSGSVENNKGSSSSSTRSPSSGSWTPEAGGSLDSVLSDNGPNTLANIASSLDTLWSPPMLRRTFSEVSSARRGPRSSLSVTGSPAGAADTSEGKESRVRRVPVLRRQASMPSLEYEMSEESPFLEHPPVWSPSPSLPQESVAKEPMDDTATLAFQESATTAQSESNEAAMMEVESEVPADTLTTPGTPTTPASGSTKGSRGVIHRRDTRQLHHPYRRRIPSTIASQDGSVDESILRLPAQFRRSASFSGTTNTPQAQPSLRREASTTAYMDIL